MSTLVEFLARNPDFTFNLPEHLVATRYIAAAREDFERFSEAIAGGGDTDLWCARREQLRSIAADVRAYRHIDWSADHYQDAIGCVEKADLRDDIERFRAPGLDASTLWHRETSGTTGPRLRVDYEPGCAVALTSCYSTFRSLSLAGLLTPDLAARPVFGIGIADRKGVEDRVWASPDDAVGFVLQLAYDERTDHDAEPVLEALDRFQPGFLALKPNVLASLLDSSEGDPRWRSADLEIVISSGADLEPRLRRRAQAALGVPVRNTYGMTELGLVAAECDRAIGLHIFEPDFIVEVLTADGSLSRTGSGELVVTSVRNPALVLLRFRTGDLVDVTEEPCSCGRRGRRIMTLSGRRLVNFITSDGGRFAPTNFDDLIDAFGLNEFRVTQLAVDRFLVEIELDEEALHRLDVTGRLGHEVIDRLGGRAAVDVQTTTFDRADKFQRYRTVLGSRFDPPST